MKSLSERGAQAFEDRGISAETAVRLGVFTGRGRKDDETGNSWVEPDPKGNIIVFPTIEHGVVVNEKYRAPGKKIWQKPGGKRTFYNVDVLDDPALERGDYALIIT